MSQNNNKSSHDNQAPRPRYSRIAILWRLLEGQRLRYISALASLFLVIGFGYLVPLVPMTTLDIVFPHQGAQRETAIGRLTRELVEQTVGVDFLRSNLWLPAIILVTLAAVSGFFMYMRNRLAATAAESIACRLRDRLYGHLQNLPCRFFDTQETGDLIQRCTSDVETLRGFLASQVIELGRASVMLVLVIPILLWMSVPLALVSLIAVPIILVYTITFFARVRAAFKLQDEAEGDMTSRIQENLTGIRVVRAFARQEWECERFAERNAVYRDKSYRLTKMMGWFYSTSDLLSMAQIGVTLIAGGIFLSRELITIGTLYAFLHYVGNLLWPVRQMGRTLTEAGKAFVSIDRLHVILGEAEESGAPSSLTVSANDAAAEQEAPADPPPAEVADGDIVFRDVVFSHAETAVLRGVSFTARGGETLAILGPSGSGKSTIVNLLLRFYDYDGGSIRVGGQELRDLDRKWIRSQIGVVMQEPFLYSRSLRENIKFGQWTADDAQMQKAAEMARIHETISRFEGGYEAMVGERGVTLSGGQRQRVALARALLKVPPILILDDALSAVDTRTEALILDALRQRHRRHTTLVIAHRLSTLMQADRIIVLDGGCVVQCGRHDDLVREEGLYRRLWEIQSSLEEDLKEELSRTAGQ